MRFLSAIFILFFSLSVFSQNSRNIKELNDILFEQSKFIAECEKQITATQIKNFGKKLPKIAGECEWSSNGCPIKIVKPIYRVSVKKYRISGIVKLEIIIDESGKVIYSKAVGGKRVFRQNAEQAALSSLYKPKIICGKAVMQKKYIVYNFIPN